MQFNIKKMASILSMPNSKRQKGKYNRDFKFNQQSFFEDWDKDGVMNGVDCQPRNKNKQDSFPAIQSTVNNYFKVPQQSISSVNTSTVTSQIPIKLNQPIIQSNINKPVTPQVLQNNISQVHPQFQSNNIQPIKELTPKYYPAANMGVNQNNLLSLQKVQTSGLVADSNQKNIVAAKAYDYIKDKNITLIRDSNGNVLQNKDSGGYWDAANKQIVIGSSWISSKDENIALLHETGHVVNSEGYSGDNNIAKEYVNKNDLAYDLYDKNQFYNPIRDNNLYNNIGKSGISNEAKSYYLNEYYGGKSPRNEIVDTFENRLGIKSKTLGPATARDALNAGNAVSELTQKIINDRNQKIENENRIITQLKQDLQKEKLRIMEEKYQLPDFNRPVGWNGSPPPLNPGYEPNPYAKTIPISALRDENTIARVPGDPTQSYNPYYVPAKGKLFR